MITVQITWEQFAICKNESRGIRYKFEDLCRQLFTYEFLAQNKLYKYVHSNPNNPGVESEPILDEVNNKYISYQAKFFDSDVDYNQIKESAKKAVKHYRGKMDIMYLFCNKPVTTNCNSYKDIETLLNDAGITLQLITDTTILDLVRKYPILAKYYFNDYSISYEWFVNRAAITSEILGERFNKDFNLDTSASRKLSIFLQNSTALDYYNGKKRNIINEISLLRMKLGDLYEYAHKLSEYISTIPDVNLENIHDVEKWQETISTQFKDDISVIETKILETQTEYEKIKETDKHRRDLLSEYLIKLKKLIGFYYQLELPKSEKNLLNKKILVVEGRAGIGKTQLFANATYSILKDKDYALLIIGSDCLSNSNVLEQLKTNLRLDFDFEDLIDILEVIGENRRKIIPIFIDALNESWKPQLWKSVLPVLCKKISEKKYVRLAISFRSEYEKVILPERFLELENIEKIEHRGFKEDPLDAAKKFLSYYGIQFSPLHMFTANIDNPLFLTLYCKTYQGDEVELPVLYERLLEKANDNIHIRLTEIIEKAGYDQSYNLVLPIIEAISEQTLITGKRHFEKCEIESLPIWNSLGIAARLFISQLIRENILQDYVIDGKNYVFFTYDQMNDYFSAKTILSKYKTGKEIRKFISDKVLGIINGELTNVGKNDLFVHVCALYAEKFGNECIDIINDITDESNKSNLFRSYIESFEWRRNIYLSISEIMKLCDDYCIETDVVWNAFISNSVKQGHILNADSLHNVLKQYSLVERDYNWTIFINGLNLDDDRIAQLIDLYNKREGFEIGEKQIRLLLILFSWLLTSSNRWLRDTASKAMIELLKDNFKYTEYLLRLFSDVNDPYVIQRLYGIVFGACVKCNCSDKEVFKSLVCYVFDDIFNKSEVYPDILLRDYARLIIEKYLVDYPGELLDYDLKKIKPMYKSTPIPDISDQKYQDKNYTNGLFYVLESMKFEGIGMYGDFGRYVFQSAVRDFDVDQYKIFNYAMYYIINELGYTGDLFDEYDGVINYSSYDRHCVTKVERIGKKYQWIAMYNILARISDYYPIKKRYSMEDDSLSYDGPWEPYVKDFDPTLNENNLLCSYAPNFPEVMNHIIESAQDNKTIKENTEFDEEEWLKKLPNFFEYQKEDLLLTDSEGHQWVALSKYADIGSVDLTYDKLQMWNWFYGYFVTDDQLETLRNYANKKINFLKSDVTRIPETYTLYNREYPWSSGSKSVLKGQWENIELITDETKVVTSTIDEPQFSCVAELLEQYLGGEIDEEIEIPTVTREYTNEEPVTIEIDKILNATQDLLWEEEYDASKTKTVSCSHPCAEIITTLKIKQKDYDGYYCDELGQLIAFDTYFTNQKAGLIIRKDALDKFLGIKNFYLIWFVNASKEIHDETHMIAKYTDWSGLLEYTGTAIKGEYYVVESGT